MIKPAIEKKLVHTSFGDIAYLETGTSAKPPVLFVHGIPTSSYLWRHVLRFLQQDFHCFAPDLMGLGDTEVDPETCPFHMDAQAEMLVEFMAALGHEIFGLVCHDQGGAASQIIAARFPQRVATFVLTDCVCYDNWPVPLIAWLQRFARLPFPSSMLGGGAADWLVTKTPLSYRIGVYDKSKFTDEAMCEYVRPLRIGRRQQERFRRFLLAGDCRYTEQAVAGLKRFERPTAIIWAADDHLLSPSWGRQLFEDIPGAERFELVPFCGHF